MIKKILLDLDDVLVDCTGSVMRRLGDMDDRDLAWFDVNLDWPSDHGRDVIKLYEKHTGIYRSVKDFWSMFERDFWANLRPFDHMYALIEICSQVVGSENVAICTSPTKCGECHAGKLDWIEKYMPEHMSRQYLMTPRKQFCASHGTLLIDDFDQNVQDFRDHGGMGIEFPRPWNRNAEHSADPMPNVIKQLEILG